MSTVTVFQTQVLFRLVSTELLEGDFYTCANTKHKKEGRRNRHTGTTQNRKEQAKGSKLLKSKRARA